MPWPDRTRASLAVASSALLLVAVPSLVLAAEPSPTGGAGGDPRSPGQGPGLVGDPLWAIGIVVLIAIVSLVATLAWVRATARRETEGARGTRADSGDGLNH